MRNIPFIAYLAPRLATFVKYGKTELTPPTPMELVGVVPQLAKLVLSTVTFQFRHLTMTQCAVNTAVAAEVGCWFFIGECIGKGGLIGYDV